MNDTPASGPDASALKWLKILVMTMTVTIIVGFIIIVGLFIAKFNSFGGAPAQVFPEEIVLPDGTSAESFTAAKDWFAIVTADGEILIYDRKSSELMRRISISAP